MDRRWCSQVVDRQTAEFALLRTTLLTGVDFEFITRHENPVRRHVDFDGWALTRRWLCADFGRLASNRRLDQSDVWRLSHGTELQRVEG